MDVLITRALLFGVNIQASDFGKLQLGCGVPVAS